MRYTLRQLQDLAILGDIFEWLEHLDHNIRENGHLPMNDEKLMQKFRELHNDMKSQL